MKRFIIIAICAAACLGTPVAAHADSLRSEIELMNLNLEWDRIERRAQREWDQFERDQERLERDEQRKQDQFDRALAFCNSIPDPTRAIASIDRIVVR